MCTMRRLSYFISIALLTTTILFVYNFEGHSTRREITTLVTKALSSTEISFANKKEAPPIVEKDRIAVVCYVPNSVKEVQLFSVLLYGSWKYITDHYRQYEEKRALPNAVDLLVFAHPSVVKYIRHLCKFYDVKKFKKKSKEQRCVVVPQTFELNIGYGPINSFIMFNRTDIYDILNPYKYVIRTDYDVFLSPTLFFFQPYFDILSGGGGYSHDFNRKRLKDIAAKLGMKHRGVHNVGSTWFGKTDLFVRLSKKTLEMTSYMYLNEFKPNLPGLEVLNMTINVHGIWPTWWKPVSLLYGAELALNHLVANFSAAHKGEMDTSSCSRDSIWTTPHIHCWHNDCEFQKFRYITNLLNIINRQGTIPATLVNLIVESSYDKDAETMSIAEYSTYIAWNSAGKHLRKWFVKKKV